MKCVTSSASLDILELIENLIVRVASYCYTKSLFYNFSLF